MRAPEVAVGRLLRVFGIPRVFGVASGVFGVSGVFSGVFGVSGVFSGESIVSL